MPEPAVSASSLSYRVGDATLVSDVDFTATRGELIAVIGPNGAGKSTLLNLLSGNLNPSAGQVLLDGNDVAGALPGNLALLRAVLTQRSPIDIPYSAAQVVHMGRFPHRRDPNNSSERDAAAVADAMERTDTTRFAARIFATLSGGERTRVSLARVLAQETPIVFLDEPTTALDVAHQERIMRQAVVLSRGQRAVVVVLHDLNAAAVHADRIVLMHQGAVVARGRPRDVLVEDQLSDVYAQPMVVVDHPFRDCPLVLTA
ncbi:MAG: heme ABC transporter ATP-binding protein [Acidimicrobiia bacterium]|nr:MAG: heme ABC transporter ATP-binding protein [Acidimicrobiia bacterium]